MHDMRQLTQLGRQIESGSFAIIDQEIGDHGLAPDLWQVTRRVIHSTADFEYLNLIKASEGAIKQGMEALSRGCPIICDVQMIEVGLSQARLAAYGSQTYSFISDPDVIDQAKAANSTRARMAMRKAARLSLLEGSIVAIGNAPTALLELLDIAASTGVKPALVVGVPVGFVSAAESKQALAASELASIVSQGRKGGSPIAVAIIHALFYLLQDQETACKTSH